MVLEIWGQVREKLEQELDGADFRNWIEIISLKGVEGGIATIEAPTKFTGEWVGRTYGHQIVRALRELDPSILDLNFVIGTRTDGGRSRRFSGGMIEPGQGSDGHDILGSNLNSRFRFSEFVVGKPNAVAYAAAVRVAEESAVDFNPLFLYGEVGVGKTHLMHAIGWALKERDPALKIIYLSAEQFMYQFIRALRTKGILDFKEVFRSVNVLMVDDVQFIAGKESTQEEFFHTFNSLAGQDKRIILSGDRSPGKIDGLEARIRSRLQSGLVVELHPADYELRLGILQQKAESLYKRNRGLRFEKGVLEFLARRIMSNVRVLEGALNRLAAAESYLRGPITIEVARDELVDILRDVDRRTEIHMIIQCVADYYNVKPGDLVGPRRTQNITRPRQLAIYLAKMMTTRSLPHIGRAFNRDHTTILYSIERVEKLQANDSSIAEDIAIIRRRLES